MVSIAPIREGVQPVRSTHLEVLEFLQVRHLFRGEKKIINIYQEIYGKLENLGTKEQLETKRKFC